MIDRYTESLIGEQKGIPEEKLNEVREQLKPEAERVVKRILIIERIAQTQSLTATEEDIDARIERSLSERREPGESIRRSTEGRSYRRASSAT